ncbi:MAG TPA: penicillin-binding transpeptidase domain-containing protein [Bryobacteraceae bacterium]|nr:penicillin-binding transpeptidase domain-containing protein [Bryobacteraceae bacterium]
MTTDLSALTARWRIIVAGLVVLLASLPALAIPSKKPAVRKKVVTSRTTKSSSRASAKTAAATKRATTVAAKKRALARTKTGRSGIVAGGPWKEPTFADSTTGDEITGEDLTIRQAAVNALGPYNGSVVVVDPKSGRVLTIVNQKLALGSGFQPCSTIKIVCALAGLHEGVMERETPIRLGRRSAMDLTSALATSNNGYFARVGEQLGFERVHSYAKMFGLGERAGFNIDGESPGMLTDAPPKFGGVGMMTSFGEGIQLTALQLASLLSAIANGGTMYHLQYPRTEEELRRFQPRVKRQLDIGGEIPEIKPGMMGAVEYGTARRAFYDQNEPILGKTGTCTDRATPTHLGWFGSFNEVGNNKLVVVVLLTGGKAVNGPVAAQIAGGVYKNLSGQQFFAAGPSLTPKVLAVPNY